MKTDRRSLATVLFYNCCGLLNQADIARDVRQSHDDFIVNIKYE